MVVVLVDTPARYGGCVPPTLSRALLSIRNRQLGRKGPPVLPLGKELFFMAIDGNSRSACCSFDRGSNTSLYLGLRRGIAAGRRGPGFWGRWRVKKNHSAFIFACRASGTGSGKRGLLYCGSHSAIIVSKKTAKKPARSLAIATGVKKKPGTAGGGTIIFPWRLDWHGGLERF